MQKSHNITILGDSRTFDTYYYNYRYKEHYGYNSTFPYLLQKKMWETSMEKIDIIHIPDHFRSRSIENNIMRLALTDPVLVFLCNGIWEALINKGHYIEYVTNLIRTHPTRSGKPLRFMYNSKKLVELFLGNKLSSSPKKFTEEQSKIASYFHRRRRACLFFGLPVPPVTHYNRLHYAGNYKCLREWDECLEELNRSLRKISRCYGSIFLDLNRLVRESGGYKECLIDQWHFTKRFHEKLALSLSEEIMDMVNKENLKTNEVSHNFMLHRKTGRETVAVYIFDDKTEYARKWLRKHRSVKIKACIGRQKKAENLKLKTVTHFDIKNIRKVEPSIILLLTDEKLPMKREAEILKSLSFDKILLYPDEIESKYYKSLKGM